MFLEIIIILIFILAVFFVAGKWNRTKKGSMLERHFRRNPYYFNMQDLTKGRIDGASGIEEQDAEHYRVRYKKGMFAIAIDKNIPKWALKEIKSPHIPENLVIVKPFLPHTHYLGETEDYLIHIQNQDSKIKTIMSALTTIKGILETQGDKTVAQDAINNVAAMIKDLKTVQSDTMKTKTELTTIETPTEQKKNQ